MPDYQHNQNKSSGAATHIEKIMSGSTNRANNTIDCIFDINGTHTILVKRGHEPYKGFWALPGGRQEPDEDLDDTVIREIAEETGIRLSVAKPDIPAEIDAFGQKTYLDQIRTYHSGKDPRGGNTTVYAVRLESELQKIEKQLRSGDDAEDARIFPLDSLPELAFDHFRFIEDYFVRLKRHKNPFPTVDAIVEYNGRYVYVDRKGIPKGKALPGGFAKYGKSYEQSITEEIKEETNLDIAITGILGVYSDPFRDPRNHMATTVFTAKGSGILLAGDDAAGVGLFSLEEVPKLEFDHNKIVEDYVKKQEKHKYIQNVF
jgi:8-oxo-dGTP diphosphatase